MTWTDANTWAANLGFTDGVRVYDDWRLPTLAPINGVSFVPLDNSDGSTDEGYNISNQGTLYAGSKASEMAHLFYNTLDNPAYYTVTGATSGCSAPACCLQNVGPFSNLKPWIYWTDTESGKDSSRARDFVMIDGYQGTDSKSERFTPGR